MDPQLLHDHFMAKELVRTQEARYKAASADLTAIRSVRLNPQTTPAERALKTRRLLLARNARSIAEKAMNVAKLAFNKTMKRMEDYADNPIAYGKDEKSRNTVGNPNNRNPTFGIWPKLRD